jgi:hypothetical protein
VDARGLVEDGAGGDVGKTAALESVLARIAAAYPAPPITPEEAEIRAEVKLRMAEVFAADPDPLGATPRERLAVDRDWLHHTAEGKRLYRRRAQWLGKMRRKSAQFREETIRMRAAVAEHDARVARPAQCSEGYRAPRAARGRRPRRCSSRGSSPGRQPDDPEPEPALAGLHSGWDS